MIFSKLFGIAVFGYLIHHVSSSAYEININGQTFQVNVVNDAGESYQDRVDFTDDFGEKLDTQPKAICSSLRAEHCPQVTQSGKQTPNLFNYFPTHKSQQKPSENESESPHLLRQPMDDRILKHLSRQNPHILGTKPLRNMNKFNNINVGATNIAQQLNTDSLKLVGSKRIKRKSRKRKEQKKATKMDTDTGTQTETENSDDYDDVEVELYSNLNGDTDLANALGLDDEELGDTVDRIVAQLVNTYLDNDSDEVDVGQIFANEMSVENGDVSMEQINLDEASMQEMSDLLNNIAKKYKKKGSDNEDGSAAVDGDSNDENEDSQIFALKFVVESDENENEEISGVPTENDEETE